MIGEKAAEAKRESLRNAYDDFETTIVEKTVAPERIELAREDIERNVVVDVRTWVERDGSVLLIRDVKMPETWMEPGGTVEANETIEAAARREVGEETGIECRLAGLRGVVEHVVRDETDESRAATMLQTYHRAEDVGGNVDEQESEIVEAAWWGTLPEEFHSGLGSPEGFGE